jgi:mxaJ protein
MYSRCPELDRFSAFAGLPALGRAHQRSRVSVAATAIVRVGLIALSVALLPCIAAEKLLRVCADPNNLPFSSRQGNGFENRLAEILARDLGAKVEYTWWPQRKSFLKRTLEAGLCDVVMGLPSEMPTALTTRPYYRSTYVFVTRKDRGLHIESLDDPLLKNVRIGIHIVGDDFAPPAYALGRRGIVSNIVGYNLFGAENEQNPPGKIIDAVEHGDVDVAIVWGPFAGYFGAKEAAPLEIIPVAPAPDFAFVPFAYDMSLAVRKGDEKRKSELEAAMDHRCTEIRALLESYGIPQVPGGKGNQTCDSSQVSQSASPQPAQ